MILILNVINRNNVKSTISKVKLFILTQTIEHDQTKLTNLIHLI